MRRTYYDALGVSTAATDADIRTAYRKLALRYHPDRAKEPDAHDRFLEVARAYEALKDPARRKAYDDVLAIERALGVEKKPPPRPTPPAQQPPPRPQATVAHGSDAVRLAAMFARGRFAEAEKLAERMIAHDQRDALAHAVLGDIARFRGELRKAAEQYAYAAQMEPSHPAYQRKHEEVIRAMGKPLGQVAPVRKASPMAATLGAIVTTFGCMYVGLAVERPLVPFLGPISTWTLGLIAMLFMSGLGIGAGMSVGGMVERFSVMHGALATRFSPSAVLGVVAAANFWAAALLYLFIGAAQQTMNVSTSRAVGFSALVVMLMTLSSAMTGRIDPVQTFLWGGNLIYLGTLCGWMVADAFQE